jgi:hypothetical protein
MWLVVYDLPRNPASARRNFYNHLGAYIRKNSPKFRRIVRSAIETEDKAFTDFIREEVKRTGGKVFVYEVRVSHV